MSAACSSPHCRCGVRSFQNSGPCLAADDEFTGRSESCRGVLQPGMMLTGWPRDLFRGRSARNAGREQPLLIAAAAALAFMVGGTPGSAADAGRGRQLAGRVCSVCHVVTAGRQPGVPNAPSFRSIAGSPQFRAKRAELLWKKHGAMPNFAMTAEEAEDGTACIRSLARWPSMPATSAGMTGHFFWNVFHAPASATPASANEISAL